MAVVLICTPLGAVGAGMPWYAGADGGVSSLRPGTTNSPFTLDSSVSFGAGLFVGYDVSKRISLELGYNYLGGATLKGNSGKTDIGYSALSAGALLYLYGDASDIAERNGFAGYLRLGLSSMDNRATIPLEREDNLAIQAQKAMDNLKIAMESVGGTLENIMMLRIYKVDYQKEDGEIITSVLKKNFGASNQPASTWLNVKGLANEGFMIEIEAQAVI